jgi:hypothetical protein
MRSSVFCGGTLSVQTLIQDLTPLSTACFAYDLPTEFLVGTGVRTSKQTTGVVRIVRKNEVELAVESAA